MIDRERSGRPASPSACIIDSQSVKTNEAGGPRGYDAGKKVLGRKHHIAVDTDGRLLMVNLTPADISDSAGAQVILHGILPQVLPQMADTTVYRWELNFRASVVVGVVGAGGIGFELIAALRTLQYDEVAAILLVILATVTLVDALGGALRKRFQ